MSCTACDGHEVECPWAQCCACEASAEDKTEFTQGPQLCEGCGDLCDVCDDCLSEPGFAYCNECVPERWT